MKKTEKNKQSKVQINCVECKYFYVTYMTGTPFGCRRFGFRSRISPSSLVFSSTGTNCAYFSVKNKITKTGK